MSSKKFSNFKQRWVWFEEDNPWFQGWVETHTDNCHVFVRKDGINWLIDITEGSVGFRKDDWGRWVICSHDTTYEKRTDKKIEDYFNNWKQPTDNEQDMLEMLYGVKLPWKEFIV